MKKKILQQTDDYRKGIFLLRGKVMNMVKMALLQNGFSLPANIQELKLYKDFKNLPVSLLQKDEMNKA